MTVMRDQPTLLSVTIGQSPRTDLVPELAERLPGVRIIERGLLDGRSTEEIAALAPGEGDEVLVTRLADGSSVRLSGEWADAEMARVLAAEAAGEVDGILVACSGEFPVPGRLPLPVFFPDRILRGHARFLAESFGSVCVVVPDEAQERQAAAALGRELPGRVEVTALSVDPYDGKTREWGALAGRMRELGTTFAVLDCIGFTGEQAARLAAATGATVLTARGTAAAVIGQVLGSRPAARDQAEAGR